MSYFEKENSIYYHSGIDAAHAIETIAVRYIGQNPAVPFKFRGSYANVFKRENDFKYVLDFNEKFPGTANELVVKSSSGLWSDANTETKLAIECFGPNNVYCNGLQVFRSTIHHENGVIKSADFTVPLQKGWNKIVIVSKKTNSGFGCKFGTASMKSFPFHFVISEGGRAGREGFLYTEPMPESEADKPVERWLPHESWTPKQLQAGQFERIYGPQRNVYGIAQMKAFFKRYGLQNYTIKGYTFGRLVVYIDSKKTAEIDNTGDFCFTAAAMNGEHSVIIKSYSSENGWGFTLDNSNDISFYTPVPIDGINGNAIYAAPFGLQQELKLNELTDLSCLLNGRDGEIYWRADAPETVIRPFQEGQSLFGRWNYPLGVTLYGLLRSSLALKKHDIAEYVKKHIGLCTSFYKYSVWDRKSYGVPGIDYQISGIDSLDDCGSFASAMLELHKTQPVEGAIAAAEDVADYILNKQSRLPDGALFRKNCFSKLMENTMWADDLYMSVPFLCRYYILTGKQEYIDDAARQFLLFKKYLYMPEKKIMSHVYNFEIGAPTQVAWGRGNGWVLFSLTELLRLLPQDHKERNELIAFFNELSEGCADLQDESGMWHQVLTDKESYIESSCTAMFIYAFCRGVRFGWLKDADKYYMAAQKGWEALTKNAIDKYGNIYGVCRGSGYSYSPSYYKNDLSWLLNDTHGTGIIMLAGLEIMKLTKSDGEQG